MTSHAPLRVLLLSAGALSAARLARRIAAEPGLALCGTAQDLSEAYILAEAHEPQVALIGPEFTRFPDFEGLVALFRVIGTAIVAIRPADAPPSSSAGPRDMPALAITPDMPGRMLLECLRNAPPPGPPQVASASIRPVGSGLPSLQRRFQPQRAILIGASTGGIDALVTILSAFPADCPPTAIVQHTGAAYSDSVIRVFARCCAARVLPAQNGIPMTPGTIVIGAGSRGHLQLTGHRNRQTLLTGDPPVSGHCPSIDMLFRSALPFASEVTAALLTGMGRDGAEGLLQLRQAGAMTLAQDAASSVVYGMPRAAAEMGAAMRVLPLARIAEALLSACTIGRAEAGPA